VRCTVHTTSTISPTILGTFSAVPELSFPSMMTWIIALKIDPIMAVITQIDNGAGNLFKVAACTRTSGSGDANSP
jgi:hypothetical protein